MKKSRRAALNLSVNAIVVFVLAFAMLGVGIAFINLIRENVMGVAGDVIDVEDLDRPPTAQEPLTVPREISLGMSDTRREQIGFYNRQTTTAQMVAIGISSCVATGEIRDEFGSGGELQLDQLPRVDSPVVDVSGSDPEGFSVIINPGDSEQGFVPGTYICNMVAYDSTGPLTGDGATIYERKSFFLEITP